MILVFEKNTLKAAAILNNENINSEEFLKKMFPDRYRELILWEIEKEIPCNISQISVVLDKEGNPYTLLYRGKEIYKVSDKEKKERLRKKMEMGKKCIGSFLPRNIRSSAYDISRFWCNSKYTNLEVKEKIKNFEYFSEKKLMPVSWWGPFTDAGGYANMNREIVFRLHNHHVIPKIEVCPTAPQVSQDAQYCISKYTSMDFRRLRDYPRVWSFTPIPHPQHSGKNIFFTMMETDSLHPEFSRICNTYADEVWVPSNHNRVVFSKYGVKKPIKVMPLGVDEGIYRRGSNEPIGVINDNSEFINLMGHSHSDGVRSFRFLSLFGWSYRKGVDVLIKSFVKAFKSTDDVSLIIVSRHAGSPAPDHIQVIKNEAMNYARQVRSSNLPQILLYPHVIPEMQMPSIYRMGHAFVHLSRGEGFSLPQIEASACGLPVISCNNTGMSEYLTDENAYLVKNDKQEVCSPEMHWITSYYHGQLFPKLGEDQINQAVKHMHYIFNNYDESISKGKSLRNLVYEKYTWDTAAHRVANRIVEIYDGR